MLNEVELLVAGGDREIVSGPCLICTLCSKRWIGHYNIETVAGRNRVDRISEGDVWLQPVQKQVHKSQTTRPLDQFLSEDSVFDFTKLRQTTLQSTRALLDQPISRRRTRNPPVPRTLDRRS